MKENFLNDKINILKILNIIAVILVIGLTFLWTKSTPNSNICKNCNVIVFSLDVLGAKHLPCYGYEKNTAPNLCAIAKENIFFENSYSVSQWTLPNNFSLITGYRPKTHDVKIPFGRPLSTKIKTMAQIFKENGYFTVYSGSYDAIYMPFSRGVIRGYDVDNSKDYSPTNLINMVKASLTESENKREPAFLYFYTDYLHYPYLPNDMSSLEAESKKFPDIPTTQSQFEKVDKNLIEKVKIDLKKRLASSDSIESVNYVKDLIDRITQNGENGFESFPYIEKNSYFNMRDETVFDTNNKEQMNYLSSLYDKKVMELDKQVGEVFKLINENKKFKGNTIIVFTSEHGESFGEHGTLLHCILGEACLYNEVLKTPLIIVTPNKVSKKISGNTQIIDVLPTLLGMIEIKAKEIFDGIDLTNIILNKNMDVNTDRKLYAEQASADVDVGRVLIEGNKKLYIKFADNKIDRTEYYDLEKDPNEKNNLFNNDSKNKIKDEIIDLTQKQNSVKSELDFPAWLDTTKRDKLLKNGYF